MRKIFFTLLFVTMTALFGCGAGEEVTNPEQTTNPLFTQEFLDLKLEQANVPAAPPIRGGWQNMSCVEFNNDIHEWATIGVTQGSGTNATTWHIIVHASLVHIPSGEDYVMIFSPQGYYALSFDIESDNVAYHRNLADAMDLDNPIHLFRCNTTPSDVTHIVYEVEEFDDERGEKEDPMTGYPILDEVREGSAEQSVHVLAIEDVNTINFAGGQIITDKTVTISDTVTHTGLSSLAATELKERTRVKFFSSEAEANAYAIPIRIRRTLFEAKARWYSVGLYVKVHGEPTGTIHHGAGDSNNGFERIQKIYDSDFPDTDTEKRTFIRSRLTSTAWQTGFDNGNTTFNFAGPFETEQEAKDFNHVDAAAATEYTSDKLDLRLSFEEDLRTSVAQQDMFVGGTFGGSVFAAFEIGIYTDSTANDIVRGVMTATGDIGVPSIVTFGGVTLTRKSVWSFREGTSVPAGLVDSLKDFFGFANTWSRTSIPSTAPTRTDPVPALLVFNTTARTFSTADPLTLYNIPDDYKIKWFSSTSAAQTRITHIEGAAKVYTYFNVTQ